MSPAAGDDLPTRVDDAIRRATELLVARQDADGAWRSREDDELANGHALTSHVLRALRAVPQPAEVGDAVANGMDFAEGLVSGGEVDPGSPPLPFLVTAAAGTLSVLASSRRRRRAELVAVLVDYLCDAQYAERAGYTPGDAEYGGFGYRAASPAGEVGPRIPELDHPHLSATIFAVEALVLSGRPAAEPALRKVRAFVERCQNYAEQPSAVDDGGFVFSPVVPSLNKAGTLPDCTTGFRSYGTMTANGVRLLSLLGYGRDDARFRAAASWLRANFRSDAVAGEFPTDRVDAQASVFYYWVWTAATALDILGDATIATAGRKGSWARELATELVERQRPDGSWRNAAPARKENLTTIADMVSLPALAICRRHLAG